MSFSQILLSNVRIKRRVHLVRRTGPRIKGSINSFVAPLPTHIEMRLLHSLKMKQRGQSAQPKKTQGYSVAVNLPCKRPWVMWPCALCLLNGVDGMDCKEERSLPPLIIRAHLQESAAICGVTHLHPSKLALMTVSVELISLRRWGDRGAAEQYWGRGGKKVQVFQTS